MRRLLVLFVFGSTAAACASAPLTASPARAKALPPARERAAEPDPQVSACRAVPSTVYGDEALIFEIEGARPGATAQAELLDERGQRVLLGSVQVPGTFRPAGLPSGDFQLLVGPSRVACAVTVNRELSRATEAMR